MCKAWSMAGFYDENDEISKNAIAFTANEPKIWGKCNQIILVTIPNEGNRRNFNNGQSICQYFSNYLAFLEISQMYRPVAAPIDIG